MPVVYVQSSVSVAILFPSSINCYKKNDFPEPVGMQVELALSASTFLDGHTFFAGKRAGGWLPLCSTVRFLGFAVADVGDWLPPTTVDSDPDPHLYTPVLGSRLGATCVSHAWINDSSSFTPLMWKNIEILIFANRRWRSGILLISPQRT